MIYLLVAMLVAAAAAGAWLVVGSAKASRSATRTAERAPEVEAWAAAESPQVMVANHSSSPVHEVRAFVALGRRRRPTCVGWIRTLPPTGDEAARVALTADSRESWLRWRDGQARQPVDVAVEVTFRDNAGQHWRRDRSGALTAIEG
ncbi:hypothetical protein [Nocardioides gilvus]|uniref:hypothetical protein n=1 Tax=Nocardioides gilvus TaxID=1735589 RepID=UPI000D7445CF|nr:hypothetical protein [Nocardioides gilvus]